MEKDYKKIFAENLKDQLYLKNITRKELYEKIGCSKNAISTWLSCKREITLSNLCKIAEVLDCSLDDLINEVPLKLKNK